MQRINIWRSQFNWRLLLVRVLVNALALGLTALLVPHIYLDERNLANLLLLAVLLGLLNAIVKPIIQFATLRFIFATYGVVVALINAAVLYILSWIAPERFEVDGILWAIIGGAVLGLISTVLENLFGITPPIVSEKYPDVRRSIADRQSHTVQAQVTEVTVRSAVTAAAAADAGVMDAKAASAVLQAVGVDGGELEASASPNPDAAALSDGAAEPDGNASSSEANAEA